MEPRRPPVSRRRTMRHGARGEGEPSKARRADGNRAGQGDDAEAAESGQRQRHAEDGVGGPPEDAADIRRELDELRRLQRRGPIARNSATVITTATATASIATATVTAYAPSQCAPPRQTSTLTNGAASTSPWAATATAIAVMRTAKRRHAETGDARIRSRSPRA